MSTFICLACGFVSLVALSAYLLYCVPGLLDITQHPCLTFSSKTELPSLHVILAPLSLPFLRLRLLKIALHVTFISENLSHMLHNELTGYSLEKDLGSASPPMDVDLEVDFVGDDSMSDQV